MIPSAIGLLLMAAGVALIYLGMHGQAGWLEVVPQQPLVDRPDLSASSGHTAVQ